MARKRRYRGGGLAEVAESYGIDPEDVSDPPVTGALEEATALPDQGIEAEMAEPSGKASDRVFNYGVRARLISGMSRDEAISRLTAAREKLLAQPVDRSSQWLAMAQGMLAPTRTGGFGESVSNAAGQVRAASKTTRDEASEREKRLLLLEDEMAKSEQLYADREIDILGHESDMVDAQAVGARGVGFPAYWTHPDTGKKRLSRAIVDPTAPGGHSFVMGPDNTPLEVPDAYDPDLLYARNRARTSGVEDAKDVSGTVELVKGAKGRLAKSYWGLGLLKRIKEEGGTGGFPKYIQQIREFFGSDAKDVTDRGMLMNLMGQQLFETLDHFGSQINAQELLTAKKDLAAGIDRPAALNERMLQQLVTQLEDEISSGTQLVRDEGSEIQKRQTLGPMTNYGLLPEFEERVTKRGWSLRPYERFQEDEQVSAQREVGYRGHMDTPFRPKTKDELRLWLTEKDDYGKRKSGIQAGDYILVPGDTPDAPAKLMKVPVD